MTASKIRADYEALAQIAQSFSQQAESVLQMLGALQKDLGTLQDGDWVGKGADRFYAEMKSAVLPAMKRVVAAMNEAASTTLKISGIMKLAEDQSAALFRLDDSGTAAGAKAPAGASAFFGGDDGGPAGGGAPANPQPAQNKPSGRVVKIEHGNPLTWDEIKDWRHKHPSAVSREVDREEARGPQFSPEHLKQAGYRKARTDGFSEIGSQTEVWLKETPPAEDLRIERYWSKSPLKRVPPGPGYFKDAGEFSAEWESRNGFKPSQVDFGNKPGTPITVEQFWKKGYYYATSQPIRVDPFNGKPRFSREIWVNDKDGTQVWVDQPMP